MIDREVLKTKFAYVINLDEMKLIHQRENHYFNCEIKQEIADNKTAFNEGCLYNQNLSLTECEVT